MKITFGLPILFKDLEEGHAFIHYPTDCTVYKKVKPFGDQKIQMWNVVGFALRGKPWNTLTDEDEVWPIIEVET